jgi:hypothetical protein
MNLSVNLQVLSVETFLDGKYMPGEDLSIDNWLLLWDLYKRRLSFLDWLKEFHRRCEPNAKLTLWIFFRTQIIRCAMYVVLARYKGQQYLDGIRGGILENKRLLVIYSYIVDSSGGAMELIPPLKMKISYC